MSTCLCDVIFLCLLVCHAKFIYTDSTAHLLQKGAVVVKKIAIVANGEICDYPAACARLLTCDYFIACDGGLRHFAPMGITPDCIIGDFDSAPAELLESYKTQNIPTLPFPADKDETDLALAAAYALTLSPASILIIGALGRRFDHTLANVHILAQICGHNRNIPAEIWDEHTSIRLAHPAACREAFHHFPREGYTTITLLPLGNHVTGITTRGLQYPLKHETLRTGETRGVSNTFTDDIAEISVESGLLLVIRTKEPRKEAAP